MSGVVKEHCTGCHTLKRVRKDETIGEHNHPVTGASCAGVDKLSMERTPLTAGRLHEQLREVARLVTQTPGWHDETTMVLRLQELLSPRIGRVEQENAYLRAEAAILADTVVMADELLDGRFPEGSSLEDAATEALADTVRELKEKYPRLRGR